MEPLRTKVQQATPLCMGQLLLSGGFMQVGVLKQALCTQKWSRRRIGDELQQHHALGNIERKTVLRLQKKLISAAAMAAFMSAASGAVTANEIQQSGWQKFISTKILQAVSAPSQLAWGQQQSGNILARFNVETRDLSELSRSRDGTLTLSFGQKGLNVMKRF
jgi:hypothetical protein